MPAQQQPQGEDDGGPADAYKVMVFAFLRNTHEDLRGLLADLTARVQEAADAQPFDPAKVRAAREALSLYVDVLTPHMKLEDDHFFPMLNEHFGDTASKEGFYQEHVDCTAAQAELAAAFAACDSPGRASALVAAVAAFVESEGKHLEHEERIMMPLTQKLPPGANGGRAYLVRPMIALLEPAQRELLVKHVVAQMARRNPYRSLRMFVAAVQRTLLPEEYVALIPAIREAAGEARWAKLAAHGMGLPGKFNPAQDRAVLSAL